VLQYSNPIPRNELPHHSQHEVRIHSNTRLIVDSDELHDDGYEEHLRILLLVKQEHLRTEVFHCSP